MAGSLRRERIAGIVYMVAAIAHDLPAVPMIALVLGKGFRRRSHEDLVGGLLLSAFVILEDPAQARLGGIDAERVF